ncbi:hypothetical protein AYO47_06920 [Planctomyces sp. SCGC AG-212-M04]|nr:hypothetical protein AYO47_06920 [Planctomyces sp. SCGC AG-212-M04]
MESRSGFVSRLKRIYVVRRSRKRARLGQVGISVDALEARLLLSANVAPVNVIPGGQSTMANVPVQLTALGNNRVSVSDSDTGASPLKVTLGATHGVVSLLNPDPASGLRYSAGDGTSDLTMTFTGTLAEINRALQWVVFTPDAGYVGHAASVTITSDDQNLESGDPGSDSDVIPIDVVAVTTSNQVFNVKDFGAGGEGITDDAPAIRAGIAAAKLAGGGTILFPPGNYRLDSFVPNGSPTAHFHLIDCEGITFSGVGAHLNSTSTLNTYVFYLDGCQRIEFEGFSIDGQFARSGHQITQASVGAFYVASRSEDSDGIRIVDVHATDTYFFLITNSKVSTPWRARNISVEQCSIVNGFYGLNFQNNGDNVTARGFRTEQLVRSYFPWGVDSHDIEYVSTGGDAFTDCLIKAYQRDTTNISLRATIVGNTSPDAKCTLESQHNPATQPVAARVQNVQIHFDDAGSSGPKSVRFAYYQDTPNPVQTASCPTNLFDNVILSGHARRPTEFAVSQGVPGLIDTTELQVLVLSKVVIAENLPAGTVVGSLSAVSSEPNSPVYTLVAGIGAADNSRFVIRGNQISTRSKLDFEAKSVYSIRVQMKSSMGEILTQVFTIQIIDVNEKPTGLGVSNLSIPENQPAGATVGILSGIDPDAQETFTYTLVSGSGSTHNGFFSIDGNQLKSAAVFDYERKRGYSIRVRVTDSAGLTYEKILKIQVANGAG